MVEKLLYSITEGAPILGVGRTTAYQLVADGEIETVKVGSRRLIPAQALSDFVNRLRAEGGAGDASDHLAR
jgi:excisionase family DNA binding protein